MVETGVGARLGCEVAESILSSLARLREMLLCRPAEFSLESAGGLLELVTSEISGLAECPEPPTRSQLRNIHDLSVRVQALYAAAANFFGGLTNESIQNGSWSGASYSESGDWAEPQARLRPSVEVEG